MTRTSFPAVQNFSLTVADVARLGTGPSRRGVRVLPTPDPCGTPPTSDPARGRGPPGGDAGDACPQPLSGVQVALNENNFGGTQSTRGSKPRSENLCGLKKISEEQGQKGVEGHASSYDHRPRRGASRDPALGTWVGPRNRSLGQ